MLTTTGIRNGRWSVPRSAFETPPRIEFVALHWNMDPEAAAAPVVMTIDELEHEVASLQHLAGEYFRPTRKYERWATARPA